MFSAHHYVGLIFGTATIQCRTDAGMRGLKCGANTFVRARCSALACVMAMLAGCYRGNLAGPKVGVVGDSIIAMTDRQWKRLDPALADAYAYDVATRSGARIDEMQPDLDRVLTTTPDNVVIDLGTNDMGQSWAPWEQSFDAMWATVAHLSCVVYVTIRTQADFPVGADINAKIAATATANPNVRIYDWETEIGAALAAYEADTSLPPPLLDVVHPTAAGADILAAGVRRELDTCPRPLPSE